MNVFTSRIERMSYGSDGIGKTPEGKTAFIKGACQGDTVSAEIYEEHPNFVKATVTEVCEPSPYRVSSRCPYASLCGGCPWQHISYEGQLEAKREVVADTLRRIGHLDRDLIDEVFSGVRASAHDWGYRNKMEFERIKGNRLAFGMHAQGGDIFEVKSCPLLPQKLAKAPGALAGALRYLQGNSDLGIERVGIRTSARTKEIEVAVWTRTGTFPRNECAKVIASAIKGASVSRVLVKGPMKAREVSGVEVLSGKGFWSEKIDGRTMLISAPTFFQVNTPGAEQLIALVKGYLNPTPDSQILDLYSGAGTFTLPLAASGAEVVAVESYGSSVRDLRRNLENHDLDCEVIGGDVARELGGLTGFDGAVIDPPRSGLAPQVKEELIGNPLSRLVYVSCDPTTLSRDLAELTDKAYHIEHIECVDLFPQSYHVETVVSMSRTGSLDS